ncbi:MAG TPA: adenylyl-sulfate kinase [Acidimicrobiales bacterium]|nr:adenylyl-sulfate kinase [Acidimicrobiales bacterium]
MTVEGLTVWLTGLPSSGKTTLARRLGARLREAGHRVEVIDGDAVRTELGRGLGFSREDRAENVRRVGYVANLLCRNGVVVVCALVSPYRRERDEVRARHDGRFMEVHVSTPVATCAERDVKGLYARQRAGLVRGLTGVDDPYEPPERPEVVVPTHLQTVEESLQAVWTAVAARMTGPRGLSAGDSLVRSPEGAMRY